jgi:hypothetical protein
MIVSARIQGPKVLWRADDMSGNVLFILLNAALPMHEIGHSPNDIQLSYNNNVKITDAGRLRALLRQPNRGEK